MGKHRIGMKKVPAVGPFFVDQKEICLRMKQNLVTLPGECTKGRKII